MNESIRFVTLHDGKPVAPNDAPDEPLYQFELHIINRNGKLHRRSIKLEAYDAVGGRVIFADTLFDTDNTEVFWQAVRRFQGVRLHDRIEFKTLLLRNGSYVRNGVYMLDLRETRNSRVFFCYTVIGEQEYTRDV